MGITLKDVAERTGVSYQTVWRALNGTSDVRAATRARVLEVARDLGYRPNRLAAGLRTRRTRAIGLVLPNVENPIIAATTRAVEAAATEQGYSVFLMNSFDDPERERRAITALLERQVDGLIVTPAAGEHAWLRAELPQDFPIVALNRRIPEIACATILVRNSEAATAATDYLLRRGHERIAAIFAGLDLMTFRDRHEGFTATLAAHGLPVRDDWIHIGRHDVETGRAATRALFTASERPTALFAASSMLTEGALLALKELGLKHGHDVDVVGFDISYAPLLDPPLPVLLQPVERIGRLGMEVLIERIESPCRRLPHRRLPVRFSLDGRDIAPELVRAGAG